MIRIVLTDEQAEAIAAASEPIDLVDGSGRMLGRMTPPPRHELTPEEAAEIAEIKRRMACDDGTRRTTAEVLERLRALAPE